MSQRIRSTADRTTVRTEEDDLGFLLCCSGMVEKKREKVFSSGWKQRFMRLEGSLIEWYESAGAEFPLGQLDISGGTVDDFGSPEKQCLSLRPKGGRVLQIRLVTSGDFQLWKLVLQAVTKGERLQLSAPKQAQPLPSDEGEGRSAAGDDSATAMSRATRTKGVGAVDTLDRSGGGGGGGRPAAPERVVSFFSAPVELENDMVTQLTGMGFSPEQSRQARAASNGNLDSACEWLSTQAAEEESGASASPGPQPVYELTGVYEIPWSLLKLQEDPFARGGGGQIFRGRYQASHIAAKQVLAQMTEADHTEFNREVSALTKLSHPNIVAFYGISSSPEGGGFMIMEYCGGGDLSSYYTKPEFSSREYARVVRELVSGVSYLHGRGFAHRDLKPENCLLEEGLRPRLKLADFGLAKVQKPSVCATRGIGTPNYMSPEMFQFDDDDDDVEEEDMDVRALDIFAIGVIMWQLWFKAVPFEGKSTHKIMNLLLRGKRMPLEATATAAAPDPTLSVLIEQCWSQEPSLRPTIDQVFESFDNIVGTS